MNRIILIGIAIAMITSCNPTTQNQKDMTLNEKKIGIVEITTFKLNQGVAVKDFELAAHAMQKDILEKQNGFIKRTLTVSQDSIWTDIVFWTDQQSVEKTIRLAEKSKLALPFMDKIDFNSVKMNLTIPILIEE